MSDIKLFRIATERAQELVGTSVQIEKTLQDLIERNMETLLGIRFLASEYSTGKTHRGRIDTLGIDENNNPVIVEYKRAVNENVINQGLFYLDWLLDHQAEFAFLAMRKLGSDVELEIDWSGPRLVCVAGDFTRYDEHAVSQINRNIELIRYRRYGEEFLILELVNSQVTTSEPPGPRRTTSSTTAGIQRSLVEEYLAKASKGLQDLFADLDRHLRSMGDDVTVKTLKHYFAYRRLKNFVSVEVHPQTAKLTAFLKVDPDSIELDGSFVRDARQFGHLGTGDLEVSIRNAEDLERAKPLFLKSYEAS